MIFIYAAVLIAATLFYILYEGSISFMIFVFALALPFTFMLLDVIAKYSVSARIKLGMKSAAAGQSVSMSIIVKNRSFVPIPSADIVVGYRIKPGGAEERMTVSTPLFPFNSQVITTSFSSKHYGLLECRIISVKLYDMLRVSRFRAAEKNISKDFPQLMILPEPLPLSNQTLTYSSLGLESDDYSKDKPGDDPSEIFAIREYADGDKLSRIHWKLTAKTDELMVKDYSLPLSDSCMIAADLYIDKKVSDREQLYDCILQMSFSISSLLQNSGIRHRTAAYSDDTMSLMQTCVYDDQTLIDGAVQQLSCGVCKEKNAAAFALADDENTGLRFGHLIYICSGLSQAAADALSVSGLAYRYTVLICCKKEDQPEIPETDIDIIAVDRDSPESSVSELII